MGNNFSKEKMYFIPLWKIRCIQVVEKCSFMIAQNKYVMRIAVDMWFQPVFIFMVVQFSLKLIIIPIVRQKSLKNKFYTPATTILKWMV